MVRYISESQLSIEEFKTPFQAKLSAENRWVKLSQVVPWDEFASAYVSMINTSQGLPGIPPMRPVGGSRKEGSGLQLCRWDEGR